MRYYVIPAVTATTPLGAYTGPKYFAHDPANLAGLRVNMQTIQYGFEDAYIVAADLTPAQHTALIANTDVIHLTNNRAANVTGAAPLRPRLAALDIPAGWITNGQQWGAVIKRLCKTALVLQSVGGEYPALRRVLAGRGLNAPAPQGFITRAEERWGITIPANSTIGDVLDLARVAANGDAVYLGDEVQ